MKANTFSTGALMLVLRVIFAMLITSFPHGLIEQVDFTQHVHWRKGRQRGRAEASDHS
jgi:hypothetical protein